LGAIVAFEMASQLAGNGQGVDQLVIVDPSPVGGSFAGEAPSDLALLAAFAGDLGIPLDRLPDSLRIEAAGLSLDEVWDRAMQRARALRLLPEDLETEDLRRRFEAARANDGALRAYRPRRYPGRADLVLAENGGEPDRTASVWRELVRDLEVFTIPGDHHGILAEPQVRALAKRFRVSRSRNAEVGTRP
jgi:thioesterase domain-containing protein